MYEPPVRIPTIRELVQGLEERVSGLADQKARVATLLRRHLLAGSHGRPYSPANSLVIGPTGGGKTFLVQQACELSGLPYIEINATQFSEVGYWGRDLAWMFQDFVDKYEMRPREITPIIERWGVVILDEVDKWRMIPNLKERQPSRALQAELLKILEGDVVTAKRKDTDQGFPVHTHHILFIGVGAFEGLDAVVDKRLHLGVPNPYLLTEPADIMDYGFIMELVGRMPSIIALPPLDPTSMSRIFMEHVLPQYVQECEDAGIDLVVDDPSSRELSSLAITKRIGARAFAGLLDGMLWRALSQAEPGDRIVLDPPAVLGQQARLEKLCPSTL